MTPHRDDAARQEAPMSRFRSPSALAASAALLAASIACFAGPAGAQQRDDAGASSTSVSRAGASDPRQDDDDLPVATRRARADERRLLGGPRSTFDPYERADPSPKSQEEALMSEERMTIVSPSAFYSSGSPALGGADGASGRSGASGRLRRFGQVTTDGNAPKRDVAGAGVGASIYRDPYEAQRTAAGQPYRSPW